MKWIEEKPELDDSEEDEAAMEVSVQHFRDQLAVSKVAIPEPNFMKQQVIEPIAKVATKEVPMEVDEAPVKKVRNASF